MKRALLLAVAAALLVAGCGDSANETTTTEAATRSVRVYFLRDGKVWPVSREIGTGGLSGPLLSEQLRLGPTPKERELGLTTEVREGDDSDLSKRARAQVVYTITQFPYGDTAIEIGGTTYTRADFEELTPAILVESPLPFEKVTSPLHVTGTANTFEATFQYELVDGDRNVLAKNFVTATSGTGTRGTFDFTVPFEIAEDGPGTLVVFELSAKDGSRINEVEIPLRLAK